MASTPSVSPSAASNVSSALRPPDSLVDLGSNDGDDRMVLSVEDGDVDSQEFDFQDPPDETLRVVVTQDGVTTIALGSATPEEEKDPEGSIDLEKEEGEDDVIVASSEAILEGGSNREGSFDQWDHPLSRPSLAGSFDQFGQGGDDSLRLSRDEEELARTALSRDSAATELVPGEDGGRLSQDSDAQVLQALLIPPERESRCADSVDSDLRVYRALVSESVSQDSDNLVYKELVAAKSVDSDEQVFRELVSNHKSEDSDQVVCRELLLANRESEISLSRELPTEQSGSEEVCEEEPVSKQQEASFLSDLQGNFSRSPDSDLQVYKALVRSTDSIVPCEKESDGGGPILTENKEEPTLLVAEEAERAAKEPPPPPQQRRHPRPSELPRSTKLNGEPSSNPLSLDEEKLWEAEAVLGERGLTDKQLDALSGISLESAQRGEKVVEVQVERTKSDLKKGRQSVSFDLSGGCSKDSEEEEEKEERNSSGSSSNVLPANPGPSPRHYPNEDTASLVKDGESEDEGDLEASQVGCLGWRLGGRRQQGGGGGKRKGDKKPVAAAAAAAAAPSNNQVLRDHCRSRDCVRT